MSKNEGIRWADEHLILDKKILDVKKPIRGVYGIFDGKECLYVGRAYSVYSRFFDYGGHVQMMMNGNYPIMKIRLALQERKKLYVKILKQVPFEGKNYYRDMQKLAYAECCVIETYQRRNQCLEQLPEGRWMTKELWERIIRSTK